MILISWYMYMYIVFLFRQSLQEYEQKLSLEKKKQESLIGQLKDQLEEMERCVAMVWKQVLLNITVLSIQ